MARIHSLALERRDAPDDGFPYRLGAEGLHGRWLDLAFEASLRDSPVRPVLRFVRNGRTQDALLPGPALGRARYLGYVPPDIREIRLAVDPEAVIAGRWRITALTSHTTAAMLARLVRRRPDRLPAALYLAARRDARRFRDTLRGALAATPLADYAGWYHARARAPDPAIDGEARGGNLAILVLMRAGEGETATRASLAVQTHPAWSLARVDDRRSLDPAELCAAQDAQALLVLEAGDVLVPDALEALADRLAATGAALAYADEAVGAQPRLKPAWSPDLARVCALYPGRPALYARDFLEGLSPLTADSPAALEIALSRAAAEVPGLVAARVTRPLCVRAQPQPVPRAPLTLRPLPAPAPLVSIVMPSRDRLDLVATSVGGVLDATDYPSLELLVVDNGSTDPAVRTFYAARGGDPRLRILDRPGPFNYSALNNEAVAQARGSVLVLLNNDVAILHPEWLTELVRHAVRPDIGAVGAKLLYADGRLQHAGVVVGLGGYAGHILRRRPGDSPGHLERLRHVHEVSAVTAACLAVSREKYLAVGGLDAEAFPVDFNDVDFCLRLGARGWRTLWTPHARLAHLESVSRGRPSGATRARFEAEAARFSARWADVIRDDPFYHPALSVTTFGEDLE